MFQTAPRSTATAGRTALALFALAAVLLSLFSFARPAVATHTIANKFEVVETSGNGSDPNECRGFDFGWKIAEKDLVSGSHTYTATGGAFSVTIDYDTTAKSVAFSAASPAVSRFVVKGGNEGDFDGRTITNYTPPVTSGGPSSPPGGKGVSHVTFCGFIPPTITVNKTGDSLSKVGDQVSYSITITNTSTTRTAHKVSINDTLAGNLTTNAGCGASLAPLGSCQITYNLTVPSGAADPWLNTVTAVYSSQAAGAGGQATVSDGHSVELFQPAITVAKTGPATADVGEEITYTVTITNSGSADSPNLVIDSVMDSLAGDLTTAATLHCGELVRNVACVFTYKYTIPDADPDPLLNTVTVHTHPKDFPNDIFASDGHSLDFELGEIIVVKDDLTDSGEEFSFDASYDESGFTLSDDGTNAADEDRNESGLIGAEREHFITEALEGDWELTGLECTSEGDSTFEYMGETAKVLLADGDTVTCTFTNDLEEEEDDSGEIKVIKRLCTEIGANNTCNGRENEFDGWEIDFEVFEGTDIEADPIGTITVTLDEGNGSQGQATDDFADGVLVAGETYTVCEVPVLRNPLTDEEVELIAVPRPDETTGGVNQSEHEDGPCIIVELTPGTNVVQFLDLVDEDEVVALTPTLVIDKTADTETITITGAAGALVASPSTVTWTLTYTLTNGPVHGAVITDPLPTGFTFLDATGGGTLVGNTVTWNLGTLTSSGSVTFRTTVDPVTVPRGITTNVATIDSNETAPDTGQDTVTVTQTGTLGGTPTPTPTPTVRQQVLTSTGVPNTSTLGDAGLTGAATIGAFMALAAAVLLSANVARARRRR